MRETGERQPLQSLTKREQEILEQIAEGRTSKQIVDLLLISVKTVDSHRGKIMMKLNVHKATSLMRVVLENGLIRQDRIRTDSFYHRSYLT